MKEAIEDFRLAVEEASNRLLLISEEESMRPRAAGKWSPKEIIGHLIDSASNNHQRFVRTQFRDDLAFLGYEQEAWVNVQHYKIEPWPQLVALWKNFNLHLAHLMKHMPEDIRKKPRIKHNLDEIAWQTVSRDEPVTLEYFMLDYIGHLNNHLRQIFNENIAS
jgi:DinB superfamily